MQPKYHKVLNQMSKFETIFHQQHERKKIELTSVVYQHKNESVILSNIKFPFLHNKT